MLPCTLSAVLVEFSVVVNIVVIPFQREPWLNLIPVLSQLRLALAWGCVGLVFRITYTDLHHHEKCLLNKNALHISGCSISDFVFTRKYSLFQLSMSLFHIVNRRYIRFRVEKYLSVRKDLQLALNSRLLQVKCVVLYCIALSAIVL